MIQFKNVPYLRPDMDALEKEMGSGIRRFQNADTVEQAYFALQAMEYPRRYYMTMATLCEAYNTMDTNDVHWAEEWAWFDQTRPRWDALITELGEALNHSPHRETLKLHLGEEMFRRAEVTGKAFSTEIAKELEEESVLSAQYSKLCANVTVEIEGKRCTMGELSRMEDKSDRASREKIDALRQKGYEEIAPELDRIYDELVHVRDRMAKKLGFQSYTDMGYCRQRRTGYGRQQVAAFRKAIEKGITPVVNALFEKQRQELGYDVLWSFDEETNAYGEGPRVREGKIEELFDSVFGALSPESRFYYQELRRCEFYDLTERKGKIRGAYSNYVPLYRMPFIFETFDGSYGAVKTFSHECGHGLHSFIKRGEPFIDNSEASSDLCEIHSMAMEFFVWPYLDAVYGPEDLKKYKNLHMKSALSFLPYGAAVDEFQTEVYDHPDMTPEQRCALWRSLEARYTPWKRYKNQGFMWQGRKWQLQTHVYKWPFYYIDYVLAQTCALQYHFMDEENHQQAWDSYMTLLRESGYHSFDKTLELTGLESPFAQGVVEKVGEKALNFLERSV